MSMHSATVDWVLDGDFLARRYSRAHVIGFDGGVQVAGSASPDVVRAPFSRADAVDPEEAFVASLAACHMLWFLDFASRAGVVVTAYRDEAEGVLGEDAEGRTAMTRVTLRPKVTFAPDKTPSRDQLERLHHQAHEACFIANSVKTDVVIEIP
jgi:organic hydroperoxide reductase OsmC/OhrA